jgi:hypothetical protein
MEDKTLGQGGEVHDLGLLSFQELLKL